MKRPICKVLAISGVFLLAACGSSSSNSASTTASTATTTAAATATTGGAGATAAGTSVAGTTTAGTSASATTSAGTAPAGGALTPASAVTGAAPTNLPAKITIGVPLDTSGVAGAAAVGVDELDGIKLAVKEINDTHFLGANTQLALDVIDTQSDKQKAVQAGLQLVSDKVTAVVGFTLTPSWQAATPAFQSAGIPAMSVELAGAGVVDGGDYLFRTYPNVSQIIPQNDLEFVKFYGAKTAAYITQSDAASAASLATVRQKTLEAAGVKTVATQTFTGKDTDLRAQLTAIKDANPDIVISTPNPDLISLVYLQAAEVGIKSQFLGAPDVSDAILKAAGPQMQCVSYTTVWNPISTASANPHFLDYWKANGTGKNPDVFHAAGYSSMWAMAVGIRTADSVKGSDIRDALIKIPNIPTAMGDMNFINERTAPLKGTKVQVQDSKLVVWDANKPCTKS